LETGPIERNLINQALRFNRPLPEKIKNAPELLPGLNLYMVGFFDLDSERPQGFSVGMIPTTAIMNYSALNDFDDAMTDDFVYLIRKMDVEYLKFQRSKQG
jgi:hypothetical protein